MMKVYNEQYLAAIGDRPIKITVLGCMLFMNFVANSELIYFLAFGAGKSSLIHRLLTNRLLIWYIWFNFFCFFCSFVYFSLLFLLFASFLLFLLLEFV